MTKGPVKLLSMIALTLISGVANAQFGSPLDQQRATQMDIQKLQSDLELARMQADVERMRVDAARDRAEAEQERRAQELRELAERQAERDAEAARKAEEAADDARDEALLASVRSADNIYLCTGVAALAIFGFLIAKKASKEGGMTYQQKFGVSTMVAGALAAMLALALSENWSPRLDPLQNVMLTLFIALFEQSDTTPTQYLILVDTKYVLFGIAVVVAYGFMTYVGITPAWRRKPASPAPEAAP